MNFGSQPEPIAVVGSACRFPGKSHSPAALWDLLKEPHDVSCEIPDERFELKGYYNPKGSHHGSTNVTRAYMIDDDVCLFDAAFFNISPHEAIAMDPQQRILLEVVYEALEAGGHSIASLRGSDTAVYVGTMSVDYNDTILRDIASMPMYNSTGTSRAILSNRVSYFFDWHGPSMTIDTACSSSMVALHQGVQSLRAGEARAAVVGGTELLLGPEQFVSESKMGLLSPTGQSRMWDADANGYARGDGVASLVLKKLSDAIADGDHVECIIRETGVNHDGKSNGLTVPSSEAQEQLIRSTYARAGLDISNSAHWPQFFEAHGTGTKAGDPREAAAISASFNGKTSHGGPLYVGSVKTVIGHTEGTAGLAGVIKASLCLQNGLIPPNMLLRRLNPDIEQFYSNLLVPTQRVVEWPDLPLGEPRRASINSFGFGGTNGHAILESFEPSEAAFSGPDPSLNILSPSYRPLLLSASSEKSLKSLILSYAEFLGSRSSSLNLRDLTWTLQSRRSELPYRVAFTGTSVEKLVFQMTESLNETGEKFGPSGSIRATPGKQQCFGIFTGQGAQWPGMGTALINHSEFVRKRLAQLDNALCTLPVADRPSWNLSDQLRAGKDVSRLGEAALSQPLCTAIQIVIVDLLRSAGIYFTSVVGHSSGEIAAAYAADFISGEDAIRIAYYRGVHAKLAQGNHGQKGGMLAVGIPLENAEDLLSQPLFKGRVQIACQNSDTSLTLSGDADALDHIKGILDEEKKFARKLLVDTAYHSYHMLKCGEPYIESLLACDIQINRNRKTTCTWFSSVNSGKPMEPCDELRATYWRDNMVNTVQFTDAVKKGVSGEHNIAIEVGPHPALKGPALQNIAEVRSAIPYAATLQRGRDDVEAVSGTLGFLWTHFLSHSLNFNAYEELVFPQTRPAKLLPGLPTYPWNHDERYLHETRLSKQIRLRGSAMHELLGTPAPDNTHLELRWNNLLKSSELPWLDGHQIQGQILFPAAGYVAMALEAGQKLASERSVRLLDVHDLVINRALTFDDDPNFAIETLVTVTGVKTNNKCHKCDFALYACSNTPSGRLDLVASAKVVIHYGEPSFASISSVAQDNQGLISVEGERFYKMLDEIGYNYSKNFRTLSATRRRQNYASGIVSTYEHRDDEEAMLVHPTYLDSAFQATFLAQSCPGDEQLWTIHVPVSIGHIRVNPGLCASLPASPIQVTVTATIKDADKLGMNSNIDISGEDGQHIMIRVEDMIMKPLSPATPSTDRPMFSKHEYNFASPDILNTVRYESQNLQSLSTTTDISTICESLAHYYAGRLRTELSDTDWKQGKPHHTALRKHVYSEPSGACEREQLHPRNEWKFDDQDKIAEIAAQYPHSVDIRFIKSFGESLPAILREDMNEADILEKQALALDLFQNGLGFSSFHSRIFSVLKTIAHRYPHMSILELGTPVQQTPESALETLKNAFKTYTYTNSPQHFTEKLSRLFDLQEGKIISSNFDAMIQPSSQGYQEHTYDVLIAPLSIRSIGNLKEALKNLRRLLKPGGYLIFGDLLESGPLRYQIAMDLLLEGWPKASCPERAYPGSIIEWSRVLQDTGFSCVDGMAEVGDRKDLLFSVMITQAVDDRVHFLRDPLRETKFGKFGELFILGCEAPQTTSLAKEIVTHLSGHFDSITTVATLPGDDMEVSPMAVVINLMDIVSPIFENFSESSMEGLKCIFETSKAVLWITRGSRQDSPYHSASLGFGRSIAYEVPQTSLQFLDFDEIGPLAPQIISETLIRLLITDHWSSITSKELELLWSREPEYYVENGRLLIPRIVPNDLLNARFNSNRRAVAQEVNDATEFITATAAKHGRLILHKTDTMQDDSSESPVYSMKFSTSTAHAISDGTFLYIGIGKCLSTGESAILLSKVIGSLIRACALVPCSSHVQETPEYLSAIAAELLTENILSRILPGDHILILDANRGDCFRTNLEKQAAKKGLAVTIITTDENEDGSNWSRMDDWMSNSAIVKLIPNDVTHFLHLSIGYDDGRAISLRKNLPLRCREIPLSDILQRESLSTPSWDRKAVEGKLGDHMSAVDLSMIFAKKFIIEPVKTGDMGNEGFPQTVESVIDWKATESTKIPVKRLTPDERFSKDKTYLLIGLTGEIGKSLAEWMACAGAGCICLASRNPKPDHVWSERMSLRGATIKFLKVDAADLVDLFRAVSEVRKSCPPIAGIINGAALFQDMLFSDMPYEAMRETLRPKIDVTRNLDEIFDQSTSLDFFIAFSSLTCIIGNPGQSNYTAANAYMNGLMSQRRKRGLSGTSLDIGRIVGIGHMSQEGGDIGTKQLIRFGCMALSEPDFLYMFSEAINCSRRGVSNGAHIVTGLRTIESTHDGQVPWIDNPRFSHKVVRTERNSANILGNKSTLSLQERLIESSKDLEALEILKEGLSRKLARIARLAEDSIKHDVPLLEFGVDSLGAVEIRGWFLKELNIDMPVVKIIGGATIADICHEAIEKGAWTQSRSKGNDDHLSDDESRSPEPKKPSPNDTQASMSGASHNPKETSLVPNQTRKEISCTRLTHQSPPFEFVKSERVSFPQSRFWFLSRLIQDQTTFNVSFYYKITGELRIGDFERAVRLVCNKHESLRTCFVGDEKDPDLAYQYVLPRSSVRVERKKIKQLEELETEYNAMRAIPFDLADGALMRLVLLTVSPSEHFLLVNYHHILMDGVSWQYFMSDLEKAYKRQHIGLASIQLPAFSRQQRAAFEAGEMEEDIEFWRQQFPNGHPVLPLLPMAITNSRKNLNEFNVFQVERRLDATLMPKIRQAAKANASTAFHVYLAAFRAMLFRLTDAEDMTIGVADANRNSNEVIGTIGLLLNLLTLRFTNSGEQTFDQLIADSRRITLQAMSHSRVPFDILLSELRAPRSSSYSPFFQAFFDYRQGHSEKQAFGNTEFETKALLPGRTAYDVTLDITDGEDTAVILFRTQAGLYDEMGAHLLVDTYIHFLESLVTDTSQEVKSPPLFSNKQVEGATKVGRGLDLVSTWPETLPRRIDQIAAENPNTIALKDGHGRSLRYLDMILRIEAIAESLQAVGVKPSDRVLVFQDATTDWPCSMLSIMRIGAVYVPLDLRNPLSRLASVASSCEPTAILIDDTTSGNVPKINVTHAKIVNVTEVKPQPNRNVENISKADSVAAILYTSGSTGAPKGIVVKHSGLRNEIEGYTRQWGLKAEYALQQSAFTFNHSSDQIYTGLVNGGCVYIVPWAHRGDPTEITKLMAHEGISYTKATPAEYSLWLEFGSENLGKMNTWKFAFGGGEPLTETLVHGFAKLNLSGLRLFNSYGPTEISISSTKMEIDYRAPLPAGRIPCGYSLPNYVAYILDDKLNPVPTGMPGELWIGGAGVSLGYLKDDSLTSYHFANDPYATPEYVQQGWTRMFRTGDIAHLKEDGAMVFRGRVAGDSQVKIRGLRIELGDIENNIVVASRGMVREAAVTLRDGEPQFLVAYVVFSPKHILADPETFLEQLLANLEVPQYMIPAMALPLDKMPLNYHNKIDRKALKELPLPKRSKKQEHITEMTETMVQLSQLWKKVLGDEEYGTRIDATTNFFTTGGNSLLVVRLQSQLRSSFNISVPLSRLINASILKDMARVIEESQVVDEIDWEQETSISDIETGTIEIKCRKESDEKEVLITGAGGFLGKHILSQLITDPTISKVHCIGLREKVAGEERKLAVSSPKIISYSGDLSEPFLGLSEADFKTLAGSVDSILHMGSVRSFWDNYHLLRPSNVSSTKQIVRMAAARNIPIHYVSSAGVLQSGAYENAESVSDYPPPKDGSNGYIATRWVCEQILDRANKQLCVPVRIHRFTEARVPSNASSGPAFGHFLELADEISALPDFSGIKGHFHMAPVNEAASYLATCLIKPDYSKTSLSFHHFECKLKVDIDEMATFLHESRAGKNLPLLDGLKFVGRMKAHGLQYFVTTQNLLMGKFEGEHVNDASMLVSRR
ncbi:hypothetical protein DM02DRAFT_696056 [Periconia macrospinosa]|uniref:Uncharacterized protein n=1 Tax=Periconia macrospinosa TaxID=97972 RepID=A0A2V1E0U4_9PLEO|nr:hypothetical protein DM02DRAFT_696056 [Periconia macrospinosa]